MTPLDRNIRQRNEYEGAFVHTGVRQDQPPRSFSQNGFAIGEQVEVQGARGVRLAAAAAEFRLDAMERTEKRLWGQSRLDRSCSIHEIRLSGWWHRPCPVPARPSECPDAQGVKPRQGGL